jgi:hypothetical protein
MGTLLEDQYICHSFLLRIRNTSNKVVDKIKFCLLFSFFKNPAVYEIMWENTVQPDRPRMTILRIPIACWIPKSTNTLSDYVLLFDFPQQQWLHERASLLRHT